MTRRPLVAFAGPGPFAQSVEGDAVWFRRLDYPSADAALIDYERLEDSTSGDELLNAEEAGRRVRLVWLEIQVPPDRDDAWATFWVVVPRGTDGAIECWEVV